MILPNDPEAFMRSGCCWMASPLLLDIFVMPNADHTLISQDLRTAWPIIMTSHLTLKAGSLKRLMCRN